MPEADKSKYLLFLLTAFTFVGVLLGAGLKYAFDLRLAEKDYLERESREAYVPFLNAQAKERVAGIHAAAAQAERKALSNTDTSKAQEFDTLVQQYEDEFRTWEIEAAAAMSRIAALDDSAVVEAVARFYNKSGTRRPCTSEVWEEDVTMYDEMRKALKPDDRTVTPEQLSMLLF